MNCATKPTSRRNFLAGTACAVLCEELIPPLPAQTGAAPVGLVRVALADFPALGAVNGSVYLNVAAAPPGIYPVVLTRTAAEEFAAVSSECAHNGCVVQPYSAESGVIQCNCHGSRYTAQGVVVQGPAQRNLPAYPVRRRDAQNLEVEIPGIGFALAAAVLVTSAGPRLRLAFPTVSGLRYAVRERTQAQTVSTPAPFSLTEAGPTDQASLLGHGLEAVIFLPAPAAPAFYSVVRSQS